MKIHELKTDPRDFDSVLQGWKTLEVRVDDRGYRLSDYLLLRRTKNTGEEMRNGLPLNYTGNHILCKITHLQSKIGMKEGWVALSIKVLDVGTW